MDVKTLLFQLLIIVFLSDDGMALMCINNATQNYDQYNYYNGRYEYKGEIYCDRTLNYNVNWPAPVNYQPNVQYRIKLWLNNLDEVTISSNSILHPNIPNSGYIEFKVTNSEIFYVPPQVHNLNKVQRIELTGNKIVTVDFSMFLNMNDLVSINVSNNNIEMLQSENNDERTSINKVELIDLSHNSIRHIPHNYFTEFINLIHLNLTNNYIEEFEILTFEGLSKLTSLYVSYNKLKAVDDTLMRFVNLKELTLDNNHISSLTEVNFKRMYALQRLNLSCNLISNIEENTFQSLKELVILDLNNNNISVLSRNLFKSNRKIEFIDLSYNEIKSMKNIFNGMNISYFRINNNHIIDDIGNTTFSDISDSILDLSYNSIINVSDTAFQSLNSLIQLDLSFNNITELCINLSSNKELKYLNVSHNRLKTVTNVLLHNLTSLTTLDFSNNLISDVEESSFKDLSHLEQLVINNNLLTHTIKPHFFHGLTSLTKLDLVYIRADIYENYTFSGLNSLKVLNSSYGELTEIYYSAFNGSGPIETLDLSHNILEIFLIDLKTISTVKKLLLQNNKLRYISKDMFSQLNNLRILNLASNNIYEIEANAFKMSSAILLNVSDNEAMGLKGLEFENINLLFTLSMRNIRKPFSFEKVQNMSVLMVDISACNIEIIQSLFIYKINGVDSLHLSSNKITNVDRHSFQNMPYLRLLDLSFNQISSIQPGTFHNTNMINFLNLTSNHISSLKYGVFDGLDNLRSLDISNNLLHSFEANILHNIQTISTVYLDDNVIDQINFNSFAGTSVLELSIGGNLISCDEFVSLKKHIPESLKITARINDYHSENVNGITCKTASKMINGHALSYNNSILPNITAAFDALANAMEMFRGTIENVARNNAYKPNDAISKREEDVLVSLNKLIKVYNESQTTTNIYLKKLLDKNSDSQLIVSDRYKADSNSDINIPGYVTLGCLVALLGLFIYLTYSYYNWRHRKLESDRLSTSQQLMNGIEME